MDDHDDALLESHHPEDPEFTLPHAPIEHRYQPFEPVTLDDGLTVCGRDHHGQPYTPPHMASHVMTLGEQNREDVRRILDRFGLPHWYSCEPIV